MGVFDPPLADLLIVNVKGARAALADRTAVIVKLEFDCDLAGGKRVVRLDRIALSINPVVAVLQLSVFYVETPAAEAPTLSDDHALRGFLRYLEFGGNSVRSILDVEGRVFQHRAHAGIKRHRSPPPHQRRPARKRRHKTLDPPVVQRQHVVLFRLYEKQLLKFLKLV